MLAESCVAALDHKTPTVKAQTADFLARAFCRSTPTTLPKKLLKMFVSPLLKVSSLLKVSQLLKVSSLLKVSVHCSRPFSLLLKVSQLLHVSLLLKVS